MTESTERVGAHALHPNFKLKNARRLITALWRSVPARIARERPLLVNGSHVDDRDIAHMEIDADGKRPDRIPLAYDQETWGSAIVFRRDLKHSCGTAACIAGFAWLLREADTDGGVTMTSFMEAVRARSDIRSDMDPRTCAMENALAGFLGVSIDAARRMSACELNSQIQPRHAVAMLEDFIETGRVDWRRALGRTEVRRTMRDWKGLRPWRKQSWTEKGITERERRIQQDEDAEYSRAVAEWKSRSVPPQASWISADPP